MGGCCSAPQEDSEVIADTGTAMTAQPVADVGHEEAAAALTEEPQQSLTAPASTAATTNSHQTEEAGTLEETEGQPKLSFESPEGDMRVTVTVKQGGRNVTPQFVTKQPQ